MGLEEIVAKIEEKNIREIEAIKREASKEVEGIKEDIERNIEELIRKGELQAKRKANELKQQMLQEARLKKAKEILRTKNEILDGVFGEAMRKFENLSEEKYLRWMEKLVLGACEGGENELIFSEEDKKRLNVEDFTRRLNKKLEGESSIKLLNEKRPFRRGFILKQKRKEINCSLDSLLEEKLDKLKIKIGEILFNQIEIAQNKDTTKE